MLKYILQQDIWWLEMSSVKNNRKEMVHTLLLQGYSQEQIAGKLNISDRTVRRDMRKIQGGSKYWFENLAKGELVNLYHETLNALKLDLTELNEIKEEASVKKDPYLKLKIIKQISETRNRYGALLHKGPMVWAMNIALKQTPEKIPMPIMDCLK